MQDNIQPGSPSEQSNTQNVQENMVTMQPTTLNAQPSTPNIQDNLTKAQPSAPIEQPTQPSMPNIQENIPNDLEPKNKKGSSLLIIILTLLVIGLVGYIVYDKFIANNDIKNTDNESKNNDDASSDEVSSDETSSDTTKLQEGTFKITNSLNNGYGTAFVQGYVTVEERYNCFDDCEIDENTPKVKYVSLNILENENQDFDKFLFEAYGNSYVTNKSVGLGCYVDNVLTHYNDSDVNGMKEYQLSVVDSVKIMNSTINNPIFLELERLEFNGGSGAPTCYSHITNIKVVE